MIVHEDSFPADSGHYNELKDVWDIKKLLKVSCPEYALVLIFSGILLQNSVTWFKDSIIQKENTTKIHVLITCIFAAMQATFSRSKMSVCVWN